MTHVYNPISYLNHRKYCEFGAVCIVNVSPNAFQKEMKKYTQDIFQYLSNFNSSKFARFLIGYLHN